MKNWQLATITICSVIAIFLVVAAISYAVTDGAESSILGIID